MVNGKQLNEELDFKKKLKEMSLEDRSLYNAEHIFDLTSSVTKLSEIVEKLDTKLDSCLPSSTKKTSAISGGLSGAITGIIFGILSYFFPKG